MNPVFDLKFSSKCPYNPQEDILTEEFSHEYRQAHFFPDNSPSSNLHFPKVRKTLSRQPQDKKIHQPESIPVHGLCENDLPGKPAGHRSVPVSAAKQAVPYGNQKHDISQYSGQRQQSKRLANLRRFRAEAHLDGTSALLGRQFRAGAAKHDLHLGRVLDRLVPERVSMGAIPENKGRDKASYSSEPSRKQPELYFNRRKDSQRQRPGHPPDRTKKLLCNGSGIPGLRLAQFHAHEKLVFSHPIQIDYEIPETLLEPRPQGFRIDLRPDDLIERRTFFERLSGKFAENQVYRFGNQKKIHFSGQPKKSVGFDGRGTVPLPLAGGTFLKSIKQNLRIKAFCGTSENAVKNQIWSAVRFTFS